jgi:hypothetical protein
MREDSREREARKAFLFFLIFKVKLANRGKGQAFSDFVFLHQMICNFCVVESVMDATNFFGEVVVNY